jgi:FkbM family methyltransferase
LPTPSGSGGGGFIRFACGVDSQAAGLEEKEMNLYLRNLLDYTKEFGLFSAILLILQRKFQYKMIKVKPKGIKHWIYCRNGTSDFAVLRQVIGKRECAFNMNASPSTIIDAGANVGYSSVLFSNLWKNARIIAIEPEEENFKMLLRNTRHYSNIECVKAAIWSKSATLKLKNQKALAFSFQYCEQNPYDSGVSEVEALTVKEICRKFRLDPLNLLKIDIEGGEFEILINSDSDWHQDADTIAIELHEWIVPGVEKLAHEAMKGRSVSSSGEYTVFTKQ